MACLAGLTSNPNDTAALKAGTFFVFFFETCYCLGFLGIPFLYASEIAPVHLRAAVCGVSTAISWLFKYVVQNVRPVSMLSTQQLPRSGDHTGWIHINQLALFLPLHGDKRRRRHHGLLFLCVT
jgi:hypothetical protein